jgi:hypothetical protein
VVCQAEPTLYATERQRFEYSGERMLNRIPKQRAIEILVAWPQDAPLHGVMRNLSSNGMSFTTTVLLQLNQVVRIDCSELRALARGVTGQRK